MIGSICLWNFSADKTVAEVGYALNPQFHNQGIMSEAMEAVLKLGFEDYDFEEIVAFTHYGNKSSKKLLEKHDFELAADRSDKENSDNRIYSLTRAKSHHGQ